MTCHVYIATSIDGFIADRDGRIEWLGHVPAPPGDDLGFADFIGNIDAIVMGRGTFEAVIGFGVGWPYPVPGIVLSRTLTAVPDDFAEHVEIAAGEPAEIISLAAGRGWTALYVDGGKTVQGFLREDLVDELTIAEIPILLGGGTRLFGQLAQPLGFELVDTSVLLKQIVKRRFRRLRTTTLEGATS